MKDDQVNRQMLTDRDMRFDASTATLRKDRSYFSSPALLLGANAWRSGRTVQLTLHEVPVKNLGS